MILYPPGESEIVLLGRDKSRATGSGYATVFHDDDLGIRAVQLFRNDHVAVPACDLRKALEGYFVGGILVVYFSVHHLLSFCARSKKPRPHINRSAPVPAFHPKRRPMPVLQHNSAQIEQSCRFVTPSSPFLRRARRPGL